MESPQGARWGSGFGSRQAGLHEWLEELKEGPRYAEVTNIEQETKDYTGRLGDFDVKF